MKVKDVIINAARLVLKDETADKYAADESLDSEEEKAIKQLIRAYNLVLKEVATDYLPLTLTEERSGGMVEFSSFSNYPLKILSVRRKDEKIDFEIKNSAMVLPKGEGFSISYSYLPNDQTPSDDFPYENKRVEDRAFCYGVASEFCLMNGRYDEAGNWDSKYRRAVDTVFKHSAKKIKGRSWV